MKTLLQIGEVARLLGVTPKTIRHYQKIGLLAEPERTHAQYRLYNAHDLLRLQRIRRLQALGLSLKQIKAVLGDARQEQTLREVLQSLDEELTTQIQELEERRQKIKMLLANDAPEALNDALHTSPTAAFVKEHLGDGLAQIYPELWKQEVQVYEYLDNFNWTENYQEKVQQLAQHFVHYFTEHPEEHQQMLALAERFASVSSLPKDDPAVQQLAEDFAHLITTHPFWIDLQAQFPQDTVQQKGPFARIFTDLLQPVYSPTQLYILEEMMRRQDSKGPKEDNI